MFIHPSNHCIYCSIGRKTTCHGERPCASWPSLASRLLHPYRVRNDKSRVASVQTSCHRECSVAILAFVITSVAKKTKKQVWLVRRLLLSLRSIASDKNRMGVDCHAVHSARLVMTRTTDAFHRNDKVLGQGTCLQFDMTKHL